MAGTYQLLILLKFNYLNTNKQKRMAHTKRIAAGLDKEHVWVATPAPGAHARRESITLLVIVRDHLKYADTTREATKIINDGMVLVDGRIRNEYKYGVGLMDIISIPKAGKSFRVISTAKGLKLKEIPEEEAKFKLCKILDKSLLKGGAVQLTLHDGTTIKVPAESDRKYVTRDTVVLDLSSREVKDSIEFNIGNTGLVVKGRHIGKVGKIEEIVKGTAARKSLTAIDKLPTLTEYVFVIGKDEPMISI